MRRHLTALLVPSLLVILYAVGCGSAKPPELVLEASPRTFPDGGVVRLRAQAFTGEGKVGTGTVQLQSTAGSLMGGVELPLDSFGTASTDLECPQTEAACRAVVRVVGTWTSQGQKAETELRIGQSTGAGGGGGGNGSVTGGGSGATGTYWTPRKPDVCQPAADNKYHPGLVDCCSSGIPLCTSIVMTDQSKVKVHFLPPGTTTPPGQELELTAIAPDHFTDPNCNVGFGLVGPNSTPLRALVSGGAIRTDGIWVGVTDFNRVQTSFQQVPPELCTEWNKAETRAIYLAFNWSTDGMGGYAPKIDLMDGTWQCYPAIVDGGATDEPTQFVVVIRK